MEDRRDPKVKDKEAMEALLKKERSGWTRISPLTLQYVSPHGYGFVTNVDNEWKWIAHPNGQDRMDGTASILQTATETVQNKVNAAQ